MFYLVIEKSIKLHVYLLSFIKPTILLFKVAAEEKDMVLLDPKYLFNFTTMMLYQYIIICRLHLQNYTFLWKFKNISIFLAWYRMVSSLFTIFSRARTKYIFALWFFRPSISNVYYSVPTKAIKIPRHRPRNNSASFVNDAPKFRYDASNFSCF